MKEMIKKVPVPLCGVMLGTAALGNLLQSYSEGIRQVCGLFAALLLVGFSISSRRHFTRFLERSAFLR